MFRCICRHALSRPRACVFASVSVCKHSLLRAYVRSHMPTGRTETRKQQSRDVFQFGVAGEGPKCFIT